MKIFFILFGLLSFVGMGCLSSQKQIDVPATVKSAFTSMYPEVKKVKWDMEKDQYEAEFVVDQVETSVRMTANGSLVLTETEIGTKDLPQAISSYIQEQMGKKKIGEAYKIVSADGKTSFEVEVDKTDYLFDESGNFLGKETGEEDEAEDD